jgi:Resolvase, N terminal domain
VIYGYARVSTTGQTLDTQLKQLRSEGCAKIYREKQSGARADRRELLKLLKAIEHGDMVTVTRIDRLARSTFDLFAIVKRIVDAGAQFRSLAEPWADTATSTGRLIVLTTLEDRQVAEGFGLLTKLVRDLSCWQRSWREWPTTFSLQTLDGHLEETDPKRKSLHFVM